MAKNSLYATLDAVVATQDFTMFSIRLWFSQGKLRESSHWLQSYHSINYRYVQEAARPGTHVDQCHRVVDDVGRVTDSL